VAAKQPAETPSSMRRLTVTVRGVVQGVGFRPFVYNVARKWEVTGWVQNEAGIVRIEARGTSAALEAFLDALRHTSPPQACIDAIEVEEVRPDDASSQADALATFEIRASQGGVSPQPTIPADLATCPECLAEIRDPLQRRHNYPFTNCTNCGPRWSIIERLPYDRPRTSMASFEMCPECRAEYENPADRRFHAQPIACPRCGPTLQLLNDQGREIAVGQSALAATVQSLLAGQVATVKGLGGFQLLVDATNAEAIARLRRRKHRPDRPFAVMLPSLDEVRAYCHVSEEEAHTLGSHQSPIVLLRRRAESALKIDEGVAPNNPYLGVMLPYTPLHHLLMAAVDRPVICTSGNLAEEPMATTTEDALQRLGRVTDVFLTHNRPIVRPVDDSIVRLGPSGVEVLRRARGFAPLPLEFHANDALTILAVGGHLKNTVALALGKSHACDYTNSRGLAAFGTAPEATLETPTQIVLSAHVGDLDNVPSVGVFSKAIDDLLDFFQASPDVVVCDLHPDYASTRHAERLAERWNVPLLRVQHHHAHVAAGMAEHKLRGPVLGFAWDGAGYGPDGTVWGGESHWCEAAEYRRAAHLRTFALPGGDRAAREPRRSALGILFELFGDRAAERVAGWFDTNELRTLFAMLSRGVNSPRTSSMGRLFDAVATICGLPAVISFEGQAAMSLEYAADENETGSYAFALSEHDPRVIDWEPVICAVLADRDAGVPVSQISARFHHSLADMALAVARSVGPNDVILTGGCFQNAVLAARVRSRLSAAGFSVYNNRMVPPGDGGIALGQAFLALQRQGPFDVPGNPG